MNKETYIDALERKLWDRLDPDQLRDIISYYRDYFAMEAAKGISEEETIQKLGDPALLAKSILAAEGSKGDSAESEIELGMQKQGREFPFLKTNDNVCVLYKVKQPIRGDRLFRGV